MIEDATFNVIGKHGITADDPIVKAYIDLCREDEKFSVGTSITYLNVTNEFAISIQEDTEVFMLLYYDREQPLSNIHLDVLNEDKFSWDFRRIERNKIKESLKSVYYELDWLH